MIDWWLVLSGTLWIAGLSLGLATVGMARYAAGEHGRGLRDTLNGPQFQIPLNAGMMSFCLGLLMSATPLWEQLVWGILAVTFGIYSVVAWRNK